MGNIYKAVRSFPSCEVARRRARTRRAFEISRVLQQVSPGRIPWTTFVRPFGSSGRSTLSFWSQKSREGTDCLAVVPVSAFCTFISEGSTFIVNKASLGTSLTPRANNRDRCFSLLSDDSEKMLICVPCWSWSSRDGRKAINNKHYK